MWGALFVSMALRCCALLFVILARTEFSYGLLCTIPMTPIMSDHNKRAHAAFTHEVTHATRPLALIRIVIRLGYTYLLPSCIVDINSRHQERKSRCKNLSNSGRTTRSPSIYLSIYETEMPNRDLVCGSICAKRKIWGGYMPVCQTPKDRNYHTLNQIGV